MDHFSERIWADFVRGVEVSGRRQEVEVHLASGCPDCKTTFFVWNRVAALAVRESEYLPPEGLVRLVKMQLANEQAAEPQEWTMASMVFDSATQPLPMGVRGGLASSRQFLYEAEGLTVDLRLERKQQSSTFAATGQVLDKEAPLCWLGDAAVVLSTANGKTVTKTLTNNYGEFQFEFEQHDELRISIITPNRKTVRITLGDLE